MSDIESYRSCTLLIDRSSQPWKCLQEEAFLREARLRLIITYFTAEEQISLCERLNLPEPSAAEIAAVRSNVAVYKKRLVKGRDGKLRTTVLFNHEFTFALTGYRLNTDKEHIAEAAHIHQHSISGNDDPGNGLALTPDAHWIFDRGLWTAEPRDGGFIVIVALDRFREASHYGRSLRDYHERPLYIPETARIRPNPRHFEWHRRSRFSR